MKKMTAWARVLIYGFLAMVFGAIAHQAIGQTVSPLGEPFTESIQFDILKGGDSDVAYLQIHREPGASTRPVFLEISFANISQGLEYKKLKVGQSQLASPTTLVTLVGFNPDDLYTLRVTLGYAKRSGKIVEGKDFFPGTRKTKDRVPQFCLADLYEPPSKPLIRETPIPLETKPQSLGQSQIMEIQDGNAPTTDEGFGERKTFTPPAPEMPILSPKLPQDYDYDDTTATTYTPRQPYFYEEGFVEPTTATITIDSTYETGAWILKDSCDYTLSGRITTNSNGTATIEFKIIGVKEGNFFYTISKFMPDGVIADLHTPREVYFSGKEKNYSQEVQLIKIPATLYLRVWFPMCGYEDMIILNATLPKKE